MCVNSVLAEIIGGSLSRNGTRPGGQACGFLLAIQFAQQSCLSRQRLANQWMIGPEPLFCSGYRSLERLYRVIRLAKFGLNGSDVDQRLR